MKIRFDLAYAYSPRETAIARGGNHVRVGSPIKEGRLSRRPYEALCKTSFWGLSPIDYPSELYVCPKCAEIKARLEAKGYEFERVTELTESTADLDTQPVTVPDNGEDTIITRPQPVEHCPKCGQLMDDLPPVDEIDDPDWHYFMCTACDTHRAYWWIDGRKVEGR